MTTRKIKENEGIIAIGCSLLKEENFPLDQKELIANKKGTFVCRMGGFSGIFYQESDIAPCLPIGNIVDITVQENPSIKIQVKIQEKETEIKSTAFKVTESTSSEMNYYKRLLDRSIEKTRQKHNIPQKPSQQPREKIVTRILFSAEKVSVLENLPDDLETEFLLKRAIAEGR